MCSFTRLAALLVVLCSAWIAPVQGQPQGQAAAGADAAATRREAVRTAFAAAVRAASVGPASIALLDTARLNLPAGMMFVPREQAGELNRALGNNVSPRLVGIVLPAPMADWFVVVSQVGEGYVRDDDARDWKADEMLESLRSATERDNKDRASRGFPTLELQGWVQKPDYDTATHRLVWSMATRAAGERDPGVNYNTFALGRHGYFSLNLVTQLNRIDANRAVATTLLERFEFLPGNRYEDFSASTDRVAEYGLAALVGVAVAKKTGLLALLGVFAVKFAKLGVVSVVGLGALFARFWRRRAQQTPPPASPQ